MFVGSLPTVTLVAFEPHGVLDGFLNPTFVVFVQMFDEGSTLVRGDGSNDVADTGVAFSQTPGGQVAALEAEGVSSEEEVQVPNKFGVSVVDDPI